MKCSWHAPELFVGIHEAEFDEQGREA